MNPFTQTYIELMRIAQDNEILQSHIRPGNYQSLDSKSFPKPNVSEADFPELVLTSSAITGAIIASSSRSQINVAYSWIITSGTFDLQLEVNEMLWGLYECSSEWCYDLPKLQWKGQGFIKNVTIPGAELSLLQGENNRGFQGWSVTWPVLVEMYFNRSKPRIK